MSREIIIQPVLNGFVCSIGCQRIVFDSIEDMTSQIKRYYKNPESVEKEFLSNALNKMGPQIPQPVCNVACETPVRAMTATEACRPS